MDNYELSQLCLMVNGEFRQLGYKQRLDFENGEVIIKENSSYDSKEIGRFSPDNTDQGQEIAHSVCSILTKKNKSK
ncbi:MAG: hypothetical protein K0U78_15290 [Actinomycetia bacterium]|nr:hypothetical protein [Actinomycetes bacterium]